MRFLCVPCDEAMAFVEAKGPEEGSLTAVFRCPAGGREMAMLTNPQETQVVQSLHVQLGGRTVPPEPMEAIRGSLGRVRELEQHPANEISWTPEALARLENVPDSVRSMVKTGIEDAAKQQGARKITAEVMASLRAQMGS
jgi:hypothetical protein